MKERLLSNWSFTRVLYLLIGITMVIQSTISHQWYGILFGAYFAFMGLFAFGCAAGYCSVPTKQRIGAQKIDSQDISE